MKVIVYTTPTCMYCPMVKTFLKNNNITFEEIDVSKNEKKKKELVDKTGMMTVPVTFIDNQYVIGYDINRLKKLLKL